MLMQKLVKSKSALKETLDRLTSSSNTRNEQPLSPLPPKKSLSSSTILRTVGGSPSRAKVKQDMVEFSHNQEAVRRSGLTGTKQRQNDMGHF